MLGGQIVKRRATTAWLCLLFCQNLGGKLPTLPIRHLRLLLIDFSSQQKRAILTVMGRSGLYLLLKQNNLMALEEEQQKK